MSVGRRCRRERRVGAYVCHVFYKSPWKLGQSSEETFSALHTDWLVVASSGTAEYIKAFGQCNIVSLITLLIVTLVFVRRSTSLSPWSCMLQSVPIPNLSREGRLISRKRNLGTET